MLYIIETAKRGQNNWKPLIGMMGAYADKSKRLAEKEMSFLMRIHRIYLGGEAKFRVKLYVSND